MYKKGDIVKVRSRAGSALPIVHVRLLKKGIVKERKGNKIIWPAYIGWEAKLIYKKEVEVLRKKFRIPYKFPKDVDTFVYEDDIISKR